MNIKQFLPRINKKEALVWKLWKWNNFQVELCIFKPNCVIEPHCHYAEDIEVIYLFGNATFCRDKSKNFGFRYYTPNYKDFFKFFSIPKGYYHSSVIGKYGLIVLSCQWWDKKPTTVTEDLTYASKTQKTSTIC